MPKSPTPINCPTKRAPDAGDSAASQAVSHALSFFWLDGFAVPAPAQVTQTVRRLHPKGNNESKYYFYR